MLEFVEHEDGIISIVGTDGECIGIGNFIKVKGRYCLSLNYLVDCGGTLRKIADKLDELNK